MSRGVKKWPPKWEHVVSFHADDLTECMDDIDEITLGGRGIDVFVRSGCFHPARLYLCDARRAWSPTLGGL